MLTSIKGKLINTMADFGKTFKKLSFVKTGVMPINFAVNLEQRQVRFSKVSHCSHLCT